MPEWIDDTRRTSSSKSTKQGKYELTKTEAANTGPTWICAKSSTIYYSCKFNFMGLLTGRECFSDYFASLETLFLLL